jgi:hypothetical protein
MSTSLIPHPKVRNTTGRVIGKRFVGMSPKQRKAIFAALAAKGVIAGGFGIARGIKRIADPDKRSLVKGIALGAGIGLGAHVLGRTALLHGAAVLAKRAGTARAFGTASRIRKLMLNPKGRSARRLGATVDTAIGSVIGLNVAARIVKRRRNKTRMQALIDKGRSVEHNIQLAVAKQKELPYKGIFSKRGNI